MAQQILKEVDGSFRSFFSLLKLSRKGGYSLKDCHLPQYLKIQYTYEAECIQRKVNPNHALAIDLGINNLVTAVTDEGKSFIIDGRRLKRGSYISREGKVLNADINGALNILRKSKVVGLETLYNRGEVDTPVRIRVA